MIRCNVNVVGTVSRPVEIKTVKGGNSFFTFAMSVYMKDRQVSKKIDISVASNGDDDVVLDLSTGDRVEVVGIMTFKRLGDKTYLNLSAEKIHNKTNENDSVKGRMQFRGTVGTKGVIEHEGKNGGFRTFDAFSSERIDKQQYSYIWVRFLDFMEECPDWLGPRVGINVEGKLELQIYNDSISINCRTESISRWLKESVDNDSHGI